MINKIIDTRGIIYSHPDFEKADRTALLGIKILVGSTVLTVVTSPILFGTAVWAAWTGELIFFAPTIALGTGMLTGTYLIAKSSYMAGRILRNKGLKVPHTGTYILGLGTVATILGIIFSEKSSLDTKTERMVLRGSTITAIGGYIYQTILHQKTYLRYVDTAYLNNNVYQFAYSQ